MIPTQKLKVKRSTDINCKIPMHKMKVTSRVQNTCFAPYLQPCEGHRLQNSQGRRARANANLKIAKVHKMRTTLGGCI